MKIKTAKALLAWLPLALWMGAIFAMSSVPGEEVERTALRIEVALPVVGRVLINQVTIHTVEYGVLAVLAFVALYLQKVSLLRTALTALVIAIVYGGTDELHQLFVPGRSSSAMDLGYDALGALAGVLAAWLVARAAERVSR
jgi:VanZ family protein